MSEGMYERKSRLRGKQRAKLIEMFVAGVTVRATAEITGVNLGTVKSRLHRARNSFAQRIEPFLN